MASEESNKQIERITEENKRLRLAVEELSILNDIATAITSTQSLEQIVELIVQKCVKHLKVEQGAVMILDEKDRDNPFHTMVRKQDTVADILPYRLDTQLTGWMIKNKAPLLVNDFKNDGRFSWFSDKEIPIHSLLSVPMLLKGRMVGLIAVFNKRMETGFTSDDQRLLAIIAAQSAHVIENARLYLEEQSLIKLQEEMRLATDIQVNLLPNYMPQIPGYDISGKSIPAKEVGGDYFDFIHLASNTIAFCLGDVSGKGMPAALLMANLQATLRGQSGIDVSCKQCVERSNNLIFQSTDSKKFATLFYGVLDSQLHQITYCNAGHDNPYIILRDKQFIRLNTGGVVLGFVPEFAFEEDKITLEPGSIMAIYSDGITEAMNTREVEFGEERLAEVITKYMHESSEMIIQRILEAVHEHIADMPQMDDMTLLIIKRE
ncbi:MAG: SpoIIE family protein phosphatase [bacterium]|nr:MAG: SpoIIE family protein phosphatase [bacterium]